MSAVVLSGAVEAMSAWHQINEASYAVFCRYCDRETLTVRQTISLAQAAEAQDEIAYVFDPDPDAVREYWYWYRAGFECVFRPTQLKLPLFQASAA
jgi:hypothetical protein